MLYMQRNVLPLINIPLFNTISNTTVNILITKFVLTPVISL